MRNLILGIAVIAVSSLILFGCGSGVSKKEDSKIIAKINNYELTTTDFKSEIDPILAKRYIKDPAKAKDELLDDLITKKILIQEAQKQNFDKDRVFMKEIERYWEQALLKLLIKKKSAEFLDKFGREKAEEALNEWIKDLKGKASVKIYKEVLDEIEIRD